MNTFGRIFRLTSFGESHGTAIGGIIDGVPAGFEIDIDNIQFELNRRRPGQNKFVSARNEKDQIKFLSGIFNGKTTGTPLAFMVLNEDHNSEDYSEIENKYRPSHADFTYDCKYGFRDYRGGGRSSARETISRVVAGALAKQILLSHFNIEIYAYTSQIGDIILNRDYSLFNKNDIEKSPVRCPDAETSAKMENLINRIKNDGDSIGGVITCIIKNTPPGIGEPVFGKLQANLAAAMMSINAAKGFDYGMGFNDLNYPGSQMLDLFVNNNGQIRTTSNHSGGIQGGISNGEDIYMRIAFKPVATIFKEIPTVNKNAEPATLRPKGRHDACVLPRAIPVVEAMAAMVILDNILIAKTNRL